VFKLLGVRNLEKCDEPTNQHQPTNGIASCKLVLDLDCAKKGVLQVFAKRYKSMM
jgi:hypothetical protein